MNETEKTLRELVKLQREYADFLGEELGDEAVFLYTHGRRCPEKTVQKGKEMRKQMKELYDKCNFLS